MKIVAVDVFPLAHTLDVPRGDARGISRRRQTTLVRVTCDDGAAGWGQGGSAETIRRLAPIVVGQDPRESGRLWRQMARAAGRELGTSAIQIALAWVLCQPELNAFALIGPRTPDELHRSLDAAELRLTPEQVRWLNLEA